MPYAVKPLAQQLAGKHEALNRQIMALLFQCWRDNFDPTTRWVRDELQLLDEFSPMPMWLVGTCLWRLFLRGLVQKDMGRGWTNRNPQERVSAKRPVRWRTQVYHHS